MWFKRKVTKKLIYEVLLKAAPAPTIMVVYIIHQFFTLNDIKNVSFTQFSENYEHLEFPLIFAYSVSFSSPSLNFITKTNLCFSWMAGSKSECSYYQCGCMF